MFDTCSLIGMSGMTLEDAAKIALALPNVTEGVRFRNRTWLVDGKGFAWERPLSKADVKRLGGQPAPEGPLLAVRVADMEQKEVLMMDPPDGFFDIEHFSCYQATLTRLPLADRRTRPPTSDPPTRACASPQPASSVATRDEPP